MSSVGHVLAGTCLRWGDACPTLEGASEPSDIGEAGEKSDLGDRKAPLRDEALDALAAHGVDELAVRRPLLKKTPLNRPRRRVQRAADRADGRSTVDERVCDRGSCPLEERLALCRADIQGALRERALALGEAAHEPIDLVLRFLKITVGPLERSSRPPTRPF